jgi:hypothetical protein
MCYALYISYLGQAIEHLPSKPKALSSNSSTAQKSDCIHYLIKSFKKNPTKLVGIAPIS